MTESIINALVHLFAIIESAKEDTDAVDSGELVIRPYLQKNLNNETLTAEYIKLFYDYLNFYKDQPTAKDSEGISIDSTSILQIAKICNQLNKELLRSERLIVFMQLMELIRADEKVTDKEEEFAALVALNFNLDQEDVLNLKNFILKPDDKEINQEKILIIDNKQTEWPEEMAWIIRKKKKDNQARHLFVQNLFGKITVLYLKSVSTFVFRYDGPLNLFLEGIKIIPSKSYILRPGSIIKGPNISSIYESEITKKFIQDETSTRVVLAGDKIEFKFKNSSNGLKAFSFSEDSGRLIGIMGGSGTGKTTLMNILNGKIDLDNGRLHINGFSLEQASTEGVIGYVPQDDLLFEELTVYQNLYFNAKTCFSDFSEDLIDRTVHKVLEDLDLEDIKDLKVGDPLNKTISGGQRKRLNIALELMREPSVLFVDEPTSGLSSMDSEKMMMLLKDLTRKGKLVVAIIHQPSSEIFKLFDRLWILDKGGYPIYNGNPIDAVVYFKTMNTQVNAAESECPRCGNVIPEQILQIIEAREIDERGRSTKKRRVNPSVWYSKYKENILPKLVRLKYESVLPPTNFRIPDSWNQFKIFSQRNLLSKISNRQYIIINMLEAPLLAFILGYFSKYSPEKVYSFSENINLPVYLFMSIVVSLFMGLTVSAQEIYKDRQILERESFLNLSRISYINSKIVYLFILSGIQTISFVLIGNYILEIHGMTLYYWTVLFTVSCFANLIGLNISSALNSVINIYILIPFILVPQLLLGGAMIKFDELHHSLSNQKNVPIVGDMMASRWAYEALAVAQFRYNDYEKHFFEVNEEISRTSVYRSFMVPEMMAINQEILRDSADWSDKKRSFRILKNEVTNLAEIHSLRRFPYIDQIESAYFSTSIGDRLHNYLLYAKDQFAADYLKAQKKRDDLYIKLVEELGKEGFAELENKYHNQFLEDLLMNRAQFNMVYRGDDQLIQKKDPIYMRPYSSIGRAHFYSPNKILGDIKIPTFYFNIAFIWFMTIVLYLTLLDNSLKKLIKFFESKNRDESRPSAWIRIWDTILIIISSPGVYRRALKIKKNNQEE
ncbi:ABC-type multidrug transport system, ATPase component [Ekhidna lutea]|uniref:ABC-type multidrug transport system, ATPase component n=1 Tax=Ekhidna lutea TaxID=447679 RepID=A0A239H228_EKHLU|nr:ATP-binding cassette domain-containing protein [Ekhidna lutea]SNS75469.1 ABC-type multidrug transport system, ATPase component [Ekhidna lutea]